MTSSEIVFWIIALVAAAAFIMSYTMAMLRADEKERTLIAEGYRDAELLARKRAEDAGGRAFRLAGFVTEILLIAALALVISAGIYDRLIDSSLPLIKALRGAADFVQSPPGTVAVVAGLYFMALRKILAIGIEKADAARLKTLEEDGALR